MPHVRKLAGLRFAYGVGTILAYASVVGVAELVADPGDAAPAAVAVPLAALSALSFR